MSGDIRIGQEGSGQRGGINSHASQVTRRRFILAGLAVTGASVASAYVKPALQTIGVPSAYAASTPVPNSLGCTPGFWKNHFPEAWPSGSLHDYQSNPLFRDVFNVPAAYQNSLGSSRKTLYRVLRLRGGCQRALGRHAVAAVLNAASLGTDDYGLDEQEAIDLVNAALATGDCSRIEDAKNGLEASNEGSCPLGGKNAGLGELDDDEDD